MLGVSKKTKKYFVGTKQMSKMLRLHRLIKNIVSNKAEETNLQMVLLCI